VLSSIVTKFYLNSEPYFVLSSIVTKLYLNSEPYFVLSSIVKKFYLNSEPYFVLSSTVTKLRSGKMQLYSFLNSGSVMHDVLTSVIFMFV
jgi:hypothetical protein